MDAFFSENGPLSKVISGYQIRPTQVAMSNLVDETIFNQNSLVVEAGTGIGKTFAYLAPALIRGEIVIISTATKNLQDQLYNKDIPVGIMPMSIHKLGNSSVATVPTLYDLILNNKLDNHKISSGDVIILASVGAGMNINAIVYRQ